MRGLTRQCLTFFRTYTKNLHLLLPEFCLITQLLKLFAEKSGKILIKISLLKLKFQKN